MNLYSKQISALKNTQDAIDILMSIRDEDEMFDLILANLFRVRDNLIDNL